MQRRKRPIHLSAAEEHGHKSVLATCIEEQWTRRLVGKKIVLGLPFHKSGMMPVFASASRTFFATVAEWFKAADLRPAINDAWVRTFRDEIPTGSITFFQKAVCFYRDALTFPPAWTRFF